MISAIKQNVEHFYHSLLSHWDVDFQPEGAPQSCLRIDTYKLTAKAIQVALLTGAFAKSFFYCVEFCYSMKRDTPFEVVKWCLVSGGSGLILSWQLLYLVIKITCLIQKAHLLRTSDYNHRRLAGLNLFISCKVITNIALCAFGGFTGIAINIGLDIALFANAYFWRWQSHRFTSTIPITAPCKPDPHFTPASSQYSLKYDFKNSSLSSLTYQFDSIHANDDSKDLIDLRHSEINKSLLMDLLGKLLPNPTNNAPLLLLDLRDCNQISIKDLSEILQRWPQVGVRIGMPFTWDEIYQLQAENPQTLIEYDTRFGEMAELFERQEETDVTFQLGTFQIKAHSFIFAAFQNGHPLPTAPISILNSSIPEETFKKLLKDIYLGRLEAENHDLLEQMPMQPHNPFEGIYSPDYLKTLFSSSAPVPNGITVHTEGKSYSLHPAILKARNPSFQTAIETDTTQTVNLKELGNLGPALLEYAYTNTFPFTKITPKQFEELDSYINFTDLRRLAELAYYQFLAEERTLSKSFNHALSLVSAKRFFYKMGLTICTAKVAAVLKERWEISLSSSNENEGDLDVLTFHKIDFGYSLDRDIQELKGMKEIVLKFKDSYGCLSTHGEIKKLVDNQATPPALRFRSETYFDIVKKYSSIKEVVIPVQIFKKKNGLEEVEKFFRQQRTHLEKVTFLSGVFKEKYLKIFKILDPKKTKIFMGEKIKIIYRPLHPIYDPMRYNKNASLFYKRSGGFPLLKPSAHHTNGYLPKRNGIFR